MVCKAKVMVWSGRNRHKSSPGVLTGVADLVQYQNKIVEKRRNSRRLEDVRRSLQGAENGVKGSP